MQGGDRNMLLLLLLLHINGSNGAAYNESKGLNSQSVCEVVITKKHRKIRRSAVKVKKNRSRMKKGLVL